MKALKKEKVLLINPPWYRFFGKAFIAFPIGLCYIAAVLEENGFKTQVYNSDYNKESLGELILGHVRDRDTYDKYPAILKDKDHPLWKEIESVVCDQSPDIVGITSMSGQYGSALNIAHLVKEVSSDIKVVMGGVHPTVLPKETIKNEDVDIVIRGEGEYTFLDISNSEPLKDILGVTYKENGNVINNPERPFIENLDDLPFPARHLLLEKETYPSNAFGMILASRGCPHKCIFCSPDKVWKRKVRFRSEENVISEIKHVKKEFGTQFFYFNDADLLLNRKFAENICDLLFREIVTQWAAEVRLDNIDDDLAKKMRFSGCETVFIGVESGDDMTLEKVKKGITTEEIKKGREILRENSIGVYSYFMIGFPWEKKEDIEKTVSFMREIDPDVACFNIVTPYPKTELYESYKENIKVNWKFFLNQKPEMELNDNLNKDEAYRIIRYTEKMFNLHNKEKVTSRNQRQSFGKIM